MQNHGVGFELLRHQISDTDTYPIETSACQRLFSSIPNPVECFVRARLHEIHVTRLGFRVPTLDKRVFRNMGLPSSELMGPSAWINVGRIPRRRLFPYLRHRYGVSRRTLGGQQLSTLREARSGQYHLASSGRLDWYWVGRTFSQKLLTPAASTNDLVSLLGRHLFLSFH